MNRPWTAEGLAALSVLAHAGCDLVAMAEALGRTTGDVDLALWTLVGRTPVEALDLLTRQAAA